MEANCDSSTGDDQAADRLRCCCGQPGCAYLEHNDAALGGLERDLETAARLGQALLSRHESYISESQAEHARMSAHISELESERTSLQSANEKIVAENRNLLSQLETLNTTLATSDDEVHRLENLLLDCEVELRRLNGFVRRAEELEGRVLEMERERHSLNRQLDEGQDEARGMLARWRDSERKVRELEEDMRRIEREALQERERHEEIVARIEKERVVDRELGGAEGRLKGAAAMQSIKSNATGSKNVVSHFVRDILQDNATLQAGIAELKQLLQSSNEEVQNLREQIMLHQPIEEEEDDDAAYPEARRSVSLSDELAHLQPSTQQLQQEVHVHHHYHAKLTKKEKTTGVRRSTKRRAIMPPQGYLGDASGASTPMTFYQPQSRRQNRWSVQSTATQSTVLSSIPSSPRSYFDRGNYLFDRMEAGEESSRPTSPESMAEFHQPNWKESQNLDDSGLGAFEEEDFVEEDSVSPSVDRVVEPVEAAVELSIDTNLESAPETAEQELTPKPIVHPHSGEDSQEQATPQPSRLASLDEKKAQKPEATMSHDDTSAQQPSALDILPEIRPSLTRRDSHESLVSISGMDIHIAKRPTPTASLELLRGNSAHFAVSPSQTRKISASRPLASVTEYTVLSPMFESTPLAERSVRRMPSSIEALSGLAVPAPRPTKLSHSRSSGSGIGSLVGGWVRGKWGIAPTKSAADLRDVVGVRARSDTSSMTASTRSISDSIVTEADVVSSARSKDSDRKDVGGNASQFLKSGGPLTLALPSTSPPKPIPQPKAQQQQQQPYRHNRSKSSTQFIISNHENIDTPSTPKPRTSFGSNSNPGNKPKIQSTLSTDSYLTPAESPTSTTSSSINDILFGGRSPGVNQPGFIAGFRQTRNPVEVVPRTIDEDGLRDGLNG